MDLYATSGIPCGMGSACWSEQSPRGWSPFGFRDAPAHGSPPAGHDGKPHDLQPWIQSSGGKAEGRSRRIVRGGPSLKSERLPGLLAHFGRLASRPRVSPGRRTSLLRGSGP